MRLKLIYILCIGQAFSPTDDPKQRNGVEKLHSYVSKIPLEKIWSNVSQAGYEVLGGVGLGFLMPTRNTEMEVPQKRPEVCKVRDFLGSEFKQSLEPFLRIGFKNFNIFSLYIRKHWGQDEHQIESIVDGMFKENQIALVIAFESLGRYQGGEIDIEAIRGQFNELKRSVNDEMVKKLIGYKKKIHQDYDNKRSALIDKRIKNGNTDEQARYYEDTFMEEGQKIEKLLNAIKNPKSSLRQWLRYKNGTVFNTLSRKFQSKIDLPQLPDDVEGFDEDSEFSRQMKAYAEAIERQFIIAIAQNPK